MGLGEVIVSHSVDAQEARKLTGYVVAAVHFVSADTAAGTGCRITCKIPRRGWFLGRLLSLCSFGLKVCAGDPGMHEDIARYAGFTVALIAADEAVALVVLLADGAARIPTLLETTIGQASFESELVVSCK